jgi:2-polyprenyl-3-methyl-5-hydroxy-6-metoxy-1,4-benzoquinol methylase
VSTKATDDASVAEASPSSRDDVPVRELTCGVPTTLLEYLHACPICSEVELMHYCRVASLFTAGEFICYERCAGCGTVVRNPRLPASARLSKYEDKVLTPEQKALDPKSQTHYAFMMRLIERELPSGAGRRLFDFGCGSGGFLLEARDAGFDVSGLELNKDLAAQVERELSVPVHQGLISDPAFEHEQFDVILSSQVFEHLLDPRGTLEEVRGHLNSPGLLLIEVPNLLDTRERLRRGALMDDSHLFYFTAKSLSAMLVAQGFEIVSVMQGVRPYRFAPAAARTAPLGLIELGTSVFSALQVRSSLSVLARLG